MKQKNKLSFDARKKYVETQPLEYEMSFNDGFLTGFDVARNLATNLAASYACPPEELVHFSDMGEQEVESEGRLKARIEKLRQALSELGDRMPRCNCVDAHGWANAALAADDKEPK